MSGTYEPGPWSFKGRDVPRDKLPGVRTAIHMGDMAVVVGRVGYKSVAIKITPRIKWERMP